MDEETEDTSLLQRSPTSLDAIPVYSIVLEINGLIQDSIDYSLKYEQLRTPSFYAGFIKPLVEECSQDLSVATIYALLANVLQFQKEANADSSRASLHQTRAMVSEVLAIRLLREYDDADRLNALTYDFYPLANGGGESPGVAYNASQRISALELAIKAEAKRFLACTIVRNTVRQIWDGTIMFSTSLHKLHRRTERELDDIALAKQFGRRGPGVPYKYEETSLLKLSRLRVPKYRHLLSLLSFVVFIVLFTLVLYQNKKSLGWVEIIFGLWSLGFILDELVGISDAGYGLYVLSLWNWVDLTILSLLVIYAVSRAIYLLQDVPKHTSATHSHDILASIAIFLFPRLFSIMDNYKSVAMTVVAMRKMTIDLFWAAIMIVFFSCGFWLAFTMAFARDVFSAQDVAYDMMRILFGFTPAVWDTWQFYSTLGRSILLLYLFITHFLVMTILITVLSNSFAAIKDNLDQEYHYMFTVNTITMIKSESSALFSYAAPLNLLEWSIMPLYYCMSLRSYLLMNRVIIKITHFPVLFCIYVYEKLCIRINNYKLNSEIRADEERRRVLKAKLGRDQSNISCHPRRSHFGSKFKGHRKTPSKKLSSDDILEAVFSNRPSDLNENNTRASFSSADKFSFGAKGNHTKTYNSFGGQSLVTVPSQTAIDHFAPKHLADNRTRSNRQRVASMTSNPPSNFNNISPAASSASFLEAYANANASSSRRRKRRARINFGQRLDDDGDSQDDDELSEVSDSVNVMSLVEDLNDSNRELGDRLDSLDRTVKNIEACLLQLTAAATARNS